MKYIFKNTALPVISRSRAKKCRILEQLANIVFVCPFFLFFFKAYLAAEYFYSAITSQPAQKMQWQLDKKNDMFRDINSLSTHCYFHRFREAGNASYITGKKWLKIMEQSAIYILTTVFLKWGKRRERGFFCGILLSLGCILRSSANSTCSRVWIRSTNKSLRLERCKSVINCC